MEKTQQGFQELIGLLDPAKYPRARVYVENLSRQVAIFFFWWLNSKTPIPIDTNAIESDISRVKNRIWSVGKRWSDKGLLNWLQVTLNKIFHPEMWQKLWSQYLSLNLEFRLTSFRMNPCGFTLKRFTVNGLIGIGIKCHHITLGQRPQLKEVLEYRQKRVSELEIEYNNADDKIKNIEKILPLITPKKEFWSLFKQATISNDRISIGSGEMNLPFSHDNLKNL